MTAPVFWEQAKKQLSKKDPTMRAIIRSYHGEALALRGDPFFTLARSIIGQQISVKAAESIWNRLIARLGGMSPTLVAAAPEETLRPCGLSAGKVRYLHALAAHFLEHRDVIARWPDMEDEEIIRELTTIRGIGRWTSEMFLIFGLGRPDVFPLDDLGLVKGIRRHYHAGERLPRAALTAVGEQWRPWRSVGTWYMWRVLDPVPVAY